MSRTPRLFSTSSDPLLPAPLTAVALRKSSPFFYKGQKFLYQIPGWDGNGSTSSSSTSSRSSQETDPGPSSPRYVSFCRRPPDEPIDTTSPLVHARDPFGGSKSPTFSLSPFALHKLRLPNVMSIDVDNLQGLVDVNTFLFAAGSIGYNTARLSTPASTGGHRNRHTPYQNTVSLSQLDVFTFDSFAWGSLLTLSFTFLLFVSFSVPLR
jgi:hypothetical protein